MASEKDASGQLWDATLTAAPISISGTLSPLMISVEGKTVLRSEDELSILELNNQGIKAEKGLHHAFFVQVNADSLEFTSQHADGSKGPAFKTVLSKLTLSSSSANEIVFSVSKDATLKLDGKSLDVRRETVKWPIPEPMTKQTYSLALFSNDGFSRLYDLKIKKHDAPSTPVLQNPPLDWLELGAGATYRLGYGGTSLSGWSKEGYVEYKTFSNDDGVLLGFQLGHRLIGKSGSLTESWIEGGWLIETGFSYSANSASNSDEESANASFFNQLSSQYETGPYLRSDLIRIGRFGLGVRGQVLLTTPLHSSAWIELRFY